MLHPVGKTMRSKALAVIVSVVFLFTHAGCASLDRSGAQATPSPDTPVNDFDTQMNKDAREWMLTMLIVIGVAILVGATVSASFGGNGLYVGVNQ